MAGGIFKSHPFALNPKCLVFSGINMAAYWYLPCRYDPQRFVVTAGIGVGSYIALAWYDHFYDCSTPMKAGALSTVIGSLKP